MSLRHVLLRAALAVGLSLLASACATRSGSRVYLIKMEKGDTLASIATKYDTTWQKIAKLNELETGVPLKVGTVLRVEPGPGGLVAGAKPAPAAALKLRRVATKTKSRPLPETGDAASPDEFSEDDFPDAEAEAPGSAKKRKGLFFNEGDSSSSSGLTWPVNGELSSTYGKRGRRMHHGIDIRASRGTAVMAAGKGVVEFAGRQNGYGKVVIVRHGKLKTLYAHLSSISVDTGDRVNSQAVVGEIGTSGNSSGPHLHFEIRSLKNQSMDPLSVLEKAKLLSARH